MSDEKTTGETGEPTQENVTNQDAPQTYDEATVQRLIAEAKQEGKTESWRHWQSLADKAVSSVAAEKANLQKQLDELKARQLEGMTPEQRQAAMLEAIYERLQTGGGQATAPIPATPPPDSTSGPQDDSAAAIKQQVSDVLKEMGVDPAKVDWAEDTSGAEAMKRFIKSIASQAGQPPTEAPKPQDKEENQADTSKPGAAPVDPLQQDPMALLRKGYGTRVQGA